MYASSKAAGTCFAFPDVCLTPIVVPVPIPYPNTAECATAVMFSVVVKIQNMPALHKASFMPLSTGDEAGTAGGGVASGTIKGPVRYVVGKPKVLIEGNPVVTLTDVTTHNNNNAVGAQIAPSQTLVDIG
ncbi:MAG: DUF4150 domain-containing protein [Myxococcales bacterium]|nr:DUF4150 domain-containing protein [Myxococcales bacterium]